VTIPAMIAHKSSITTQATVMIPTRSAVCRNRKFLADRAIELSYAEGTNAASFNEIRKKEAVK
jgi:hypothetical protein